MVKDRFNPTEFFLLANHLAANNSNEAGLRTAVGRVYYAAYLIALYHLYPDGRIPRSRIRHQPTNRRGSHATVIDDVVDRDSALGTKLNALMELRVQADYRLVPEAGYQDWNVNWQQADVLVKQLLPRLARM